MFLHGVARFAEPLAEQLRERARRQNFRLRRKPANVAHEDRRVVDGLHRAVHAARHRRGCPLAAFEIGFLLENQIVVGDADARSALERHGHDHTLIVDVGAVAAAEVHELILVAVVAADDGVLPADRGAEVQANRVLRRAADGGGVQDGHLEGGSLRGDDADFGSHVLG